MKHPTQPILPWLDAAPDGQLQFPPVSSAWGADTPAPGLLAGGGNLQVGSLVNAYSHGIFPWYSDDQPILWWSPQPRMVLTVADFKLHRSLRKTVQRFAITPGCEVRIDHDFAAVIAACAGSPRDGQGGTWIVQDMIDAYTTMHHAGHAHSVETWVDGKLVGALYCTALRAAVFGESMFSRQSDASKIALCALVAMCRAQGITHIDCQQNTSHLASMGASEMPREAFCAQVARATTDAAPTWRFDPVYWQLIGV